MARYFKFFTRLFFVFYILFSAALLTSCQEGSEAGDLFGQWRMDGSDSKYISFSGTVTLIKDLQTGEIYGNFQHVGDSLFIQCYSTMGNRSDTLVVEQSFGFRPLDNIRLKVITLDSDHLVLDKNGLTWSFYKY